MIQRIASFVCLLVLCSCTRQESLARRIQLSYSDSDDAPEVAPADMVVPADFQGKTGPAATVAAVCYYEQRAGAIGFGMRLSSAFSAGQSGEPDAALAAVPPKASAKAEQALSLLQETISAPGMQTKEVMAACTMAAAGTSLMRPAFDRWVGLDPDNALPYYLLAYHYCCVGTPEKVADAVFVGNGKPECRYYPALNLLVGAGMASTEDIRDICFAHSPPHPWFRVVFFQFREGRFGTSNESKRQCATALIAFGDKVAEMKPESALLFLTGSAMALSVIYDDDAGEWLSPALKAELAIRRELCKEFKTWFLAAYEKGEVNGSEERKLLAELGRRRRALTAQGR